MWLIKSFFLEFFKFRLKIILFFFLKRVVSSEYRVVGGYAFINIIMEKNFREWGYWIIDEEENILYWLYLISLF